MTVAVLAVLSILLPLIMIAVMRRTSRPRKLTQEERKRIEDFLAGATAFESATEEIDGRLQRLAWGTHHDGTKFVFARDAENDNLSRRRYSVNIHFRDGAVRHSFTGNDLMSVSVNNCFRVRDDVEAKRPTEPAVAASAAETA